MSEDLAKVQESLQQIIGMLQHLTERLDQMGTYTKPILTVREAATLIGMSHKTLQDTVSVIRCKTGKSPNFILKAGGHMHARIDRDLFYAWLRSSPKRRGRPPGS